MHTEKEHELATMIAYGASIKPDWLALYTEARAELLKLREQLASAPDWEEAVESRLRQMSQDTFGGQVCMNIRGHGDGLDSCTLSTVSAANHPFLEVTGPNFETALTKLHEAYEGYEARRKKCQTPS